jgi:hypothetical protein
LTGAGFKILTTTDNSVRLYFIRPEIYSYYCSTIGNKSRPSSMDLTFHADYVIEGKDRKVIKSRTVDYTPDSKLSKKELFMMIKAFEGTVIVR